MNTVSSYKAYSERYGEGYARGLPALNPHDLDPELLGVVVRHPCPDPRLLEIGCGEGFDARGLGELGFSVTALDCSACAISTAHLHNAHPNVNYFIFDAVTEDVALAWGHFDVVYAIGCFHVLDCDHDRAAWLSGARRALRPGGVLYLRDGISDREWPIRPSAPRPLRNTFVHSVTREVVDVASGAIVEPLLEGELRTLLAQQNLEVVSMTTCAGGRVFPVERVTVARKGEELCGRSPNIFPRS